MVSQAWKGLERYVAKCLGGKRIPRGANFSDSLPDVVADASINISKSKGVIFAECKHSKNQPWVDYIEPVYNHQLIIAGIHNIQPIVLFELADIHLLSKFAPNSRTTVLDKRIPRYMHRHIEQARMYIDLYKSDKILEYTIHNASAVDNIVCELPLVVMAKKHSSFRLAYIALKDLYNFYSMQNDKHYRNLQKKIRQNNIIRSS